MSGATLEGELVCECGCRFRCPRCSQVPHIRIVDLQLLAEIAEHGMEPGTIMPLERGPMPYAQRAEPAQDPHHWVTTEEAASLIGLSAKSISVMSVDVALHVRRRRHGHRYLWYRPDLLDLAKIREQCALSLDAALRTYGALIEGRV